MAKTKILGEPFDTYVDEQITVRQTRLGQTQKTSDDLVVFNASTPWIRLSSSVSVGADRAEKLVRNIGGSISVGDVVGSNLAKNLVLFAGSSEGAGGTQKGGLTRGGLKGAYGFLTDPKTQGYKPMPGITSISTNYKNNGSLKQAQVNLKCFSKGQFEAIETLYLRLGYTLTLEYGHSIYYNNGTKKQNMSALEIPNILFIDKLPKVSKEEAEAAALAAAAEVTDEYEKMAVAIIAKGRAERNPKYAVRIQTAIKDNKVKTSGNYDALVAKVSNFSWKLNPDLSYDIVLNLISVGDIIDSLKMNLGGIGSGESGNLATTEAGVQNITNLLLSKDTSKLNGFLYDLTQEVLSQDARTQLEEGSQELLKDVDSARVAKKLLKQIIPKYTSVIIAQRIKYINPYQELFTFLESNKVKPDFTLRKPNVLEREVLAFQEDLRNIGDFFTGDDEEVPRPSLETLSNQNIYVDTGTFQFEKPIKQAEYENLINLLPNTEYGRILKGLKNTRKNLNLLGYTYTEPTAQEISVDIIRTQKSGTLYNKIKDLATGLNKNEEWFGKLKPDLLDEKVDSEGNVTPEVDNTGEIKYLDAQSKNTAQVKNTLGEIYAKGRVGTTEQKNLKIVTSSSSYSTASLLNNLGYPEYLQKELEIERATLDAGSKL